MRIKLLLFTLLCSLAAILPAKAETLTVYENETATNGYVPIEGYWADSYLKSEFVIPSGEISEMTGGTITQLTWYLGTVANRDWGNAKFQVFIKEVESTSISAFSGTDGATIVYEGSLDGTQSTIPITFVTPYVYNGGNLLVGVYNIQKGQYTSQSTGTFIGKTVNGASVQGHNGNGLSSITPTQRNFIPKTTFTYTPSAGPVYYSPKNLTVSNIGTNEATATWTPGGSETSWNVEYKKSSDANWTSAGAVSNPTIVLDALENGTSYDVRVQGNYGSGNLSNWATTSFTTLVCDDANKGEISYVLTDTYGDGWNGNKLQIVYNGTVIEELTISTGGKDEPITGTISLCYGVDYDLVWVAGSYGYECGFVLTAPDGSVIYEFQGTGSSSGASPSNGVLTTFQINQDNTPKPTNLAISDITTTTADASWTGNDDAQSYNLRYREIVKGLVSDFEDSSLGGWTTIDADGDGYNWVLGSAVGGIYLATDASLAGSGHSPQDLVVSGSYSNISGVGALNPDNYLVSPKVQLGGTITFWAKGQDSSYPSEVFGVAVSTTGNNNPSDFTMVGANKTATAAWVQYTFDLSDFSGEGYVAIRHYNCTNQFILDVDDIVISDPQSEDDWVIVNNIDATNYNITGLTPITEYEVQVQAVYADGSSDWTNSVNFTTLPADAMPTDLTVTEITDRTATANWNGVQDSYNLRYRVLNFFENFDGGLPSSWTTIDNDGDGYNWVAANYDDGAICVSSESYHNNADGGGTALTPDNWLITPKMTLGNMISFDAWGQDPNWASEVFRVYVSTTGTAVADFIAISDDITATATQTPYSFDLSQYAGQEGYVAICHHMETDMFRLNIDNFGIGGNWVTVNNVTSPNTIEGLDPETDYEVQVQGILDNGTTNWTNSVYFTTLMKRTTLAEICQNGVITEGQNEYVIADKLIAVYADDVKGILWCKDQGNASVFSTSIKDGQVDFLKDDPQAQNGRDWDQSNWIALHFSTPTATNNIGQLVNGAVNRYIKPGTVKGKLIDDVNYALRMDLDQLELVTQADDPDINPNYIPNVYCPANFMPTNLNIWGNEEDGGYTEGSDQNYFFMNPKIQEICEVTYAQWDAINGYFTVPTSSGFDGAFYIGTGYNVIQSQNFTSSLQDEHIYRFKAIVQRSDKDNYGPKNVTTPATGITLYPVDLDPVSSEIPTAINTIRANGEVVGVEYVNSLGIVSKTPFQGVNIVVTRYSNGATTTMKKVFK